MAKAKTKKGPVETVATETSPGVWEFETGRYCWRWLKALSINLSMRAKFDDEGDFQNVLYAANLDHAIMFGQGFEAGTEYILRSNKAKAE